MQAADLQRVDAALYASPLHCLLRPLLTSVRANRSFDRCCRCFLTSGPVMTIVQLCVLATPPFAGAATPATLPLSLLAPLAALIKSTHALTVKARLVAVTAS